MRACIYETPSIWSVFSVAVVGAMSVEIILLLFIDVFVHFACVGMVVHFVFVGMVLLVRLLKSLFLGAQIFCKFVKGAFQFPAFIAHGALKFGYLPILLGHLCFDLSCSLVNAFSHRIGEMLR